MLGTTAITTTTVHERRRRSGQRRGGPRLAFQTEIFVHDAMQLGVLRFRLLRDQVMASFPFHVGLVQGIPFVAHSGKVLSQTSLHLARTRGIVSVMFRRLDGAKKILIE
jgi:hypothetical protein